jgi:hypothetical protein
MHVFCNEQKFCSWPNQVCNQIWEFLGKSSEISWFLPEFIKSLCIRFSLISHLKITPDNRLQIVQFIKYPNSYFNLRQSCRYMWFYFLFRQPQSRTHSQRIIGSGYEIGVPWEIKKNRGSERQFLHFWVVKTISMIHILFLKLCKIPVYKRKILKVRSLGLAII